MNVLFANFEIILKAQNCTEFELSYNNQITVLNLKDNNKYYK